MAMAGDFTRQNSFAKVENHLSTYKIEYFKQVLHARLHDLGNYEVNINFYCSLRAATSK